MNTVSTGTAHNAPRSWSGKRSGAPFSPAKDRTITRLAVLKAAAAFAASRPQASSSDVLKVATAWERWVNRPEGR